MLKPTRDGVRYAVGFVALAGAFLLSTSVRVPEAQEGMSAAVLAANLEARLANLDPQVRYLKDRKDIFDVAKRYTRGADRHDRELAASAFWPEATISFGTPMSRDEYVEWEERNLSQYAAHQHHITGQTVDIDGDTAHVESYVVYFLVPRDRSADSAGAATPGRALTSEKTRLGSGRYIERWERRSGEWKILVREYIEDLALLGDSVDLCTQGRCLATWDRTDFSYVRPLEHLTAEQRQVRGDTNRTPRHPGGR